MKYKKDLLFLIITLFFIICLAIYVNRVKFLEPFNSIISFILPVAFILNIITIGMININSSFSKKEEEIKKKYEEMQNSIIPEKIDSEQNLDILKLMLANMREINDYYVLSKTQAQNSFTLAVVMCIIGIVLMGVSIFAAFFQSSNVISAVIPAVGAAIVEVVAGTSLIVYKNSLSQLNRYFNSLHSNERFLSIVNIVSKASPEVQDDMYFEIIKSQIGVVSTDLVEDKNEKSKVK